MPKSAGGTYKKTATRAIDDGHDREGGSSLLPMLVSGLILIVVGMLVVAVVS